MPDIFSCQQCGSTTYENMGVNQIQCAHCGTVYKEHSDDPAVIISKGANIIIGKNANVEIKGDLEIQEGANLDIQGKVVIDDDESQEE